MRCMSRRRTRPCAIGPAPAAESYLNSRRASSTPRARPAPRRSIRATASCRENAGFAEACEQAGIVVHRPDAGADARLRPEAHGARACAAMPSVPLLPGTGLLARRRPRAGEAERIGYPVMLKSTAGGGGIGMQLVPTMPTTSRRMFERVERLARNNFKDAGVFLEKYVERGAPHRGADLRRRQRQRRRARRARLLGAAAQPEGHRGNAGAGPAGRDARGAVGTRRAASAQSVSYRSRRHRRVLYDADDRRVLLPRSEHAPAGRARRDRRGHRRRSGRVDGAPGGRRAAAARPGAASSREAHRSRCASTPRTRPRLPPEPGLLTHVAWPADTRVETWVESGIGGLALLRSDAGEDHRPPAKRATRRCASCRPRSTRPRSAASRPISTICGNSSRRGRPRPRRDADADAADLRLQSRHHRGARARHADDGAGLAGPPRLLGRRRAAVRADGSAVVPAGQPAASAMTRALRRSRSRCPGPTLRFNSDTVICLAGAELMRDARWRARALLAGRSPSRPGRC